MGKTIYDIAKEAGVSASTVSRYLNNIKVSDKAKEKLDKVLENSDFRLNQIARGLTLKQTKTVGIITVDIRVPHYAQVVYTFEQEFSKKGYNVIICNTSGTVEKSKQYIKNILSLQIDGIAFVGSIFDELNSDKEILKLLNGIPIVVANGTLELENAISVLSDDLKGTQTAVKYLYNKGRRNIYFINDMYTGSTRRKEKGYDEIIQKLGLQNHKCMVEHSIDGGVNIVNELFEKKVKFDSFICCDDMVGVGIINALNQKGIKVGQEVDVMAFNNTIYSNMTLPKLTYIDNMPVLQGQLLASKLENMINNQKEEHYLIDPEIVSRGSA